MPSGSPSACSVPASEMFIARPAIIEPSAIWLRAAASGSRDDGAHRETADARRLETDRVADRRAHRHHDGRQGLRQRVGGRVQGRQRRQPVREQRVDQRPVGPIQRMRARDLVAVVVHDGAARHLGAGARGGRDRDQPVRARRDRLDRRPGSAGQQKRRIGPPLWATMRGALGGVERGAAADGDDHVAARLAQRLATRLDALGGGLLARDLVHHGTRRHRRVGHVRIEHDERTRQARVGEDLRQLPGDAVTEPDADRQVAGERPLGGDQVKTTRGMVMPTFHMPMSTIS